MKKKLVSLLLAASMTAAVLAGCGEETPTSTSASDSTPASVAVKKDNEAVAALQKSAKYYFSCDAADGIEGIQPTGQDKAAGALFANGKEVVFIDGVAGDALYTDGISGYKLTNVNGVGDTYTVSYWLYATRFANYMPTVQFGPDVHGDATGGQHYTNITRAEWNADGASFPCVWSYDQADNAKWPAWSCSGNNEHLKEWMMITLVVDANKKSADGEYLVADLYINGERYAETDSDGNEIPINITFGCMSPSDNFDFLLGVNYWDACFKGAFDEIYVFDKALTAAEVATLYADGDTTVAYNPPARVIEVTRLCDGTNVNAEAGGIEDVGRMDQQNAFWTDWTQSHAINDGQTIQVKLKNWSDGTQTYNNYVTVFTNDYNKAHQDPNENAGHIEYAAVRADAYGWLNGDSSKTIADSAFTWDWANWNTWESSVMVEADVTLKITRDGSTITMEADNKDINTTSNKMTATFDIAAGASDPVYFLFTNEACFTEVLEIKDVTVKAGGTIVGSTDRVVPFWTAFSPIFKVEEGTSVTKHFVNYTDGINNWDNFVAILQSTPTGHSADTAGYAEYAVVRADNYGWGAGYDGIVTPTCDWNWDTFTKDMDGAAIDATFTNNGATADINIVATTADGKVYHQDYTGIVTGGDLYVCFTCENSYLQFASDTVGNTDRTTGWWTQFSDIWAVPEGESKTVFFDNFTDGLNNWDNFVVILQNRPDAHASATDAAYAEYAVVRADNYGWGAGYDGIVTPESNWDWGTFTSDMDGAHVEVTVKNNGATADILCNITTADGSKAYFQNYKGIVTGGELYFCLGCEASFLQVECENVGNTDCTTGWWTQFSDIKKVETGKTEYVTFRNYTDGVNNWDNFVVILQNTPTGHSADTAGYAEYAVVRADNYGWGAGYDGIVTPECNWNWDTFTSDMDGASVTVAVTNNGATADIVAYVTTKAGLVYTQSYKGIVTGGDLYFCLGCEASYLSIK